MDTIQHKIAQYASQSNDTQDSHIPGNVVHGKLSEQQTVMCSGRYWCNNMFVSFVFTFSYISRLHTTWAVMWGFGQSGWYQISGQWNCQRLELPVNNIFNSD